MEQAAERIRQALDRAESNIREIGADAFRAGDDAAASQARDVVVTFKALRLQLDGATPDATEGAPPTASDRRRYRPRLAGRGSRKSSKQKYPRFEVRNGAILRIGWSKKQKAEYEHRASRDTFDRTVAAMVRIAKTGVGPFTADQIIEGANDSKVSVPSYQVYVVIGLLRDHACVEQVGRDGYMIPEDLSPRARNLWNQLAGTSE